MKNNILSSLTLISFLLIPVVSFADISGLTPEQIAEIKPWASNTKNSLERLLKKTEHMTMLSANQELERGIKNTLEQSSQKYSELLMRIALTRAIKVNATHRSGLNNTEPHVVEPVNTYMRDMAKLAIESYSSDIKLIEDIKKGSREVFETKSNLALLQFNIKNSDIMSYLLSSTFDIEKSYQLMRLRATFAQQDFFRLYSNKTVAQTILDLEELLKDFPSSLSSYPVEQQHTISLKFSKNFSDIFNSSNHPLMNCAQYRINHSDVVDEKNVVDQLSYCKSFISAVPGEECSVLARKEKFSPNIISRLCVEIKGTVPEHKITCMKDMLKQSFEENLSADICMYASKHSDGYAYWSTQRDKEKAIEFLKYRLNY